MTHKRQFNCGAVLLAVALLSTEVFADEPLDRAVGRLQLDEAPIAAAVRIVARIGGVAIYSDSDVTGNVTVDLNGATVRSALDAITRPKGYYFESEGRAVAIRRLQTLLYPIDYPQLTRSGAGSASITLGGSSGGAISLATAGQTSAPAPASGSDSTQISITQANENTFWSTFEAELRGMLKEGDLLVLNRFSGVAQVTAPPARQEVIRDFIELTNRRITQQVEIEARLVEVTLRDERKLGIDWDQAAVSVGAGIRLSASSDLGLAGVGGTALSGNTFVAGLTKAGASAVIQALQQQGEVRTISQPRLRALNNQTAFIKVGQDQPFFRLQQSTTVSQPGTSTPFNQTQNSYSVSTITIGTILAVTPQVGADRVVTLDVLPAITRLQSIVSSPDGTQTAPVTEVKQASTIVRLRDGETAVIGGLIAEDEGKADRAIPLMSSLPLLGRAFRTTATVKTRTELVIFLTPRIL